nr:ABC transporter ATP-binding protein [Micromonospora sp. DSM 115978]
MGSRRRQYREAVSDVVVRLADVTVTRDGSTLLAGIDWTVSDGQRWVVLGPNGAGKSTLLGVASTRLFPTSGTVDLLGERLGHVDVFELRNRVGRVRSAVAETLPAGERVLDVVMPAVWAVVGRGVEEYTVTEVDRATGLLAQFGCLGLAERRFGTLSEGERKRVQIARALMADPELLLLDEPAAGLDLGAREALLRRLARLTVDPTAPVTVMVSHHVEEIPAGVTHALLLRSGRVVAAGAVAQTLTSSSLSECFGIPLDVDHADGRYWARLAPGPPQMARRASAPA